jgi:hypothetical protein
LSNISLSSEWATKTEPSFVVPLVKIIVVQACVPDTPSKVMMPGIIAENSIFERYILLLKDESMDRQARLGDSEKTNNIKRLFPNKPYGYFLIQAIQNIPRIKL